MKTFGPDLIDRFIDRLAPTLRDAFLAVIREIRDGVRLARLVELIKAGDAEGVIAELGLEFARWRPFQNAIIAGYETVGFDITARIDRMRRANTPRPMFDMGRQSAKQWLESYATALITNITEDQRRLVREALQPIRSPLDPIMTGETPQKLALDLVGRVSKVTGKREGGLIGMTAPQAAWVRNYEAELRGERPMGDAMERALRDRRFDRAVQKSLETGEPIPEKTIRAAVNAYRNRALRHRAENIALNEAHEVAQAAQAEGWKQAIARGVYQADEVRRYWHDRNDLRVRPWHAEVKHMNPQGVGLDEPFKTPRGPTMFAGWKFEPGCRCRIFILPLEED